MSPIRVARSLALLSILALLGASQAAVARAQSPELEPLREALAAYDFAGDRTIGALRDLHRLHTGSPGAATNEARFLRAVVAVDLLIASRIDPSRAGIATRVCDAIATPCERVDAHLTDELRAVARGAYRRPADEARTALALSLAIAGGDTSGVRTAVPGVRRDLLVLRAIAVGESTDPSALEALSIDRCATACAAPWSQLDASSRRRLDVMVEASAAMQRVERAAAGGDALAQALSAIVRPAAERIDAMIVRGASVVPESMGLDAGDASGEPVRADIVVVVGARDVTIARTPSYSVRAGEIVVRETGDDVLPRAIVIALPTTFRPVITAIDPIVDALRAREGTVVVIAATPDAPSHLVARVIASAARAERTPAMLVRRAPDGTLRAAPIALVDRDEVGVPGDVVVRVRLGGYGIARGRGREQSVPRVRGANGALGFDLDGLATELDRAPRRRTVLDAMQSLPAHDLLDVAFRISRPNAPVSLSL